MRVEAKPVERLAFDLYDAAEATGTSHTVIKRAIAAGALRAKRLGGKRIVTREDLQAWVDSWEDA